MYGSRFLNQKAKGYLLNRLANKGLTMLSNMRTHQHLTDMETCYKAFRRDVIQSIDIEEQRFGFEPEITAKISKMRIRIHEGTDFLLSQKQRRGKEDRFFGRPAGAALYLALQQIEAERKGRAGDSGDFTIKFVMLESSKGIANRNKMKENRIFIFKEMVCGKNILMAQHAFVVSRRVFLDSRNLISSFSGRKYIVQEKNCKGR